ncbi:MAG: hypothetical protein KGM03_02250 [Cytophagales bacterium]|nr:hypothetical protein [Cytophagales bacterium]
MKKAWILRLIVICSIVLLGERVSTNPGFQTSSTTFFHATAHHSDALVAIELEDETEDDVLSFFSLPSSFNWKPRLLFFVPLFFLLLYAQDILEKSPAFIRFHTLRL